MINISKHISGEDVFNAIFTHTDEELHDPVRIIFHLKTRMKERGLTQQQLADKGGVRQATISQLCRGNVEKLHIPTLEKIAAAMNITDITQLITFLPESKFRSGGNPYDIVYPNDKQDV